MMDKDIDEISRSAFPDGDVAFDPKYWDQMGAMIDQRKKKRGFIFWWGTGAAVILLIGGLFVFDSFEKDTTHPITSIQQVKTASLSGTTLSTTNNSPEATTSSSPVNNESSIAPNSTLAIENAVTNEAMNTQKRPLENNSEFKMGATQSRASETASKPALNTNDNNEAMAPENAVTNDKVALNQVVDSQISNKENEAVLDDSQPSILDNKIAVSGETDNNPKKSLGVNSYSSTSEKTDQVPSTPSNSLLNEHLVSTLSPISSGPIPIDFEHFNLYEMPVDTNFKDSETEFGEPVPSGSKLKYFIEPVVGFNSSYKTVANENRVGNSKVTLDYLPTQEFQFGLNLGAKYNNFFGAIGVHFNQIQSTIGINESKLETEIVQNIASRTVIDYIDSVLIKTPVIKVPSGSDFVFQTGDAEYNIDTTFATVYDTTNTNSEVEKLSTNKLSYKLQYLYIPIQVGYEYPIKNFFVGGGIGLDLGVLINSKGELFNPELNQIVPVDAGDLVNKTTLAYNLQLAFGYYLKPNLSVAIRPNLRQQIISPFKNTNLPNTRLGGFVALRYDF